MTFEVDRDFRDFNRFAGDGISPPTEYALPIGDPDSGAHVVRKAAIRERLNRVETVYEAIKLIQELVEGGFSDAVSQGNVPIYSTVTAVQGYTIPVGIQVIRVSGRTSIGAGGGWFKRVSAKAGIGCFQDAGGQWWAPTLNVGALSVLGSGDSIVAGVGTTGDYPDLPAAFAALLPYASAGGAIELRLVSPITKGVLLREADYSAFTITSDIGAVPLASGFVGFADTNANGVPNPRDNKQDNLLGGLNCRMPTLGCVIDMGHRGSNGYYPISNVSKAVILPGCGVINAGFIGLEARTSVVQAFGSVWDGAMLHGIRAAHGATIAAQSASCDDCVQFPALVDEEDYDDYVEHEKTAASVDCSRNSTIHFRNGTAKRSGGTGVNGRRAARLVIEGADVSNAAYHGVYLSGMSTVSAYGMRAIDCGWSAAGTPQGGYAVWARDAVISVNAARLAGSGNSGGIDIRIGDSTPYTGGTTVNASNVLTTEIYDRVNDRLRTDRSYDGAIKNINVDRFNWGNKHGIVYNASVEHPWDIGIFDAQGDSAGKKIDNSQVLRSSVTSADARTHIALHNTLGEVCRIRTQNGGGFLENVSDEALKTNVRPLAEMMAAEGVDFAEFMRWLSAEIVGFDLNSTTDLRPTGLSGVGVVAQRLAVRLPDLVSPREGEPGAEGWSPAAVNYSGLLPYAVAGWGLTDDRVRALEARVAELEARNP